MRKGIVTSIAADRERITITGECEVDAKDGVCLLHLYELQPFEDRPDGIERPRDETFRISGTARSPFRLVTARMADGRDRLYARFFVGTPSRDGTAVEPFAGVCHVERMSDIAMHDYEYPTAPTIKGLQVRMVDDAIKLGVGHAALNLNLPTIIRPAESDRTITYCPGGRPYFFDADHVAQFDRRVKELSDHGIVVNLILLNSAQWDGVEIHPDMRSALLHPDYDPDGRISAFNTLTPEGLAYYQAFVEFVAGRYTRPDHMYGRACGYIIGNEVDSQ